MTLTLTHYLVLGRAPLLPRGLRGDHAEERDRDPHGAGARLQRRESHASWPLADGVPRRTPSGQLFALFVIAAAAAESVLGLAIILAIYRRRVVVNADEMDLMKN